MKQPIHFAILILAASACATVPTEAPKPPTEAELQIVRAMEASASASQMAGDEPDAPSEAPAASRLHEGDLALWNDSMFRRRFTESYLAESEIEPRITLTERETMQKVLELISADRMDRALAMLAKERTVDSSAVFDFTIGNIHFQQEQLVPAAAAYRVAATKYPKFRRAWKNLALILVRQGEFKDAVEALTRVVELGGSDAITYGLLGFAYSNVGNDLSAETAYRMAVLLEPATMDWKMGLARSLFKQKRYADAASLCESLLMDDPDRADLWLLQANAFIGLEQPMRAAENFELVDRLGRSTTDSLNALGDIYANQELFDPAVAAYLRALESSTTASSDRAMRAARVMTAHGALEETRRLVAGIETLRGETMEVDERKELLKLRARIAVAEGAGDEEARVLEEIVRLDPLDGEALLLLGEHSARAEDFERAAFYYERAANLEAFEADAKVRHAQLFVAQGRYSDAIPLLKRAQLLKPRDHIQDYLEQVERIAQGR